MWCVVWRKGGGVLFLFKPHNQILYVLVDLTNVHNGSISCIFPVISHSCSFNSTLLSLSIHNFIHSLTHSETTKHVVLMYLFVLMQSRETNESIVMLIVFTDSHWDKYTCSFDWCVNFNWVYPKYSNFQFQHPFGL